MSRGVLRIRDVTNSFAGQLVRAYHGRDWRNLSDREICEYEIEYRLIVTGEANLDDVYEHVQGLGITEKLFDKVATEYIRRFEMHKAQK